MTAIEFCVRASIIRQCLTTLADEHPCMTLAAAQEAINQIVWEAMSNETEQQTINAAASQILALDRVQKHLPPWK